jgi:hypothetical protein
MTRESKATNYVYRVTIQHLYADGMGHYMQRTYGPYTTLATAKSQETRLLGLARADNKKADSYIEESWLEWEVRS